MSHSIYSLFFDESTKSQQLVCQYVECGQPLNKNGKFCNLTCCNRANALRQKAEAAKRRAATQSAYEANPKKCLACDTPIPYHMTLNGPVKFCNQSCAAKYSNKVRTSESRKRQGQRLSDKIKEGFIGQRKPPKIAYCTVNWKICPVTGKPYHTRMATGGRRQKSPYAKTIMEVYYQLASFRFSVYKLPGWFDLFLVNTHGWYKTAGSRSASKTSNHKGVSRDHRYAISVGLKNGVHPLLLSHPYNCELMPQKTNTLKKAKCSLTLEELIEGIIQWDNQANHFEGHDSILQLIRANEVTIQSWDELLKLNLV